MDYYTNCSFLISSSGKSGEFGQAMVCILARGSEAKIRSHSFFKSRFSCWMNFYQDTFWHHLVTRRLPTNQWPQTPFAGSSKPKQSSNVCVALHSIQHWSWSGAWCISGQEKRKSAEVFSLGSVKQHFLPRKALREELAKKLHPFVELIYQQWMSNKIHFLFWPAK